MATPKGGTAHGFYVRADQQEVFRYALRKLQRRRPGKSASELAVDCIIEAAARYQDIPGLDDLQEGQEYQEPAAAAAI